MNRMFLIYNLIVNIECNDYQEHFDLMKVAIVIDVSDLWVVLTIRNNY